MKVKMNRLKAWITASTKNKAITTVSVLLTITLAIGGTIMFINLNTIEPTVTVKENIETTFEVEVVEGGFDKAGKVTIKITALDAFDNQIDKDVSLDVLEKEVVIDDSKVAEAKPKPESKPSPESKPNTDSKPKPDSKPNPESKPKPEEPSVPETPVYVLNESISKAMLKEINNERAKTGAQQLQWSDELYRAAKIRAHEITILFDHDHLRPDGTPYYTVSPIIRGENIAMSGGSPSAASANQQFMNSPGHKAIILDDRFTIAACAYVVDQNGVAYFVELFGE